MDRIGDTLFNLDDILLGFGVFGEAKCHFYKEEEENGTICR